MLLPAFLNPCIHELPLGYHTLIEIYMHIVEIAKKKKKGDKTVKWVKV